MTQNKQDFEARIKQSLDASVAHIDSDTQQRLDQIRRDALNQTKSSHWVHKLLANWMPVTGLAFCSLFAIFMLYPQQPSLMTPDYQDQTAVLDILENAEDLDTLTDPGFYLWLDETESQHEV